MEPRPRYGDFSIFQDGGCRHLGLLKFKILTVETLKRVELHHRTKFRQHRSKTPLRYGYFLIFKMAAVCHLGFVVRVSGPPTKGIWWSLSLCKMWLESMQQF